MKRLYVNDIHRNEILNDRLANDIKGHNWFINKHKNVLLGKNDVKHKKIVKEKQSLKVSIPLKHINQSLLQKIAKSKKLAVSIVTKHKSADFDEENVLKFTNQTDHQKQDLNDLDEQTKKDCDERLNGNSVIKLEMLPEKHITQTKTTSKNMNQHSMPVIYDFLNEKNITDKILTLKQEPLIEKLDVQIQTDTLSSEDLEMINIIKSAGLTKTDLNYLIEDFQKDIILINKTNDTSEGSTLVNYTQEFKEKLNVVYNYIQNQELDRVKQNNIKTKEIINDKVTRKKQTNKEPKEVSNSETNQNADLHNNKQPNAINLMSQMIKDVKVPKYEYKGTLTKKFHHNISELEKELRGFRNYEKDILKTTDSSYLSKSLEYLPNEMKNNILKINVTTIQNSDPHFSDMNKNIVVDNTFMGNSKSYVPLINKPPMIEKKTKMSQKQQFSQQITYYPKKTQDNEYENCGIPPHLQQNVRTIPNQQQQQLLSSSKNCLPSKMPAQPQFFAPQQPQWPRAAYQPFPIAQRELPPPQQPSRSDFYYNHNNHSPRGTQNIQQLPCQAHNCPCTQLPTTIDKHVNLPCFCSNCSGYYNYRGHNFQGNQSNGLRPCYNTFPVNRFV